MVQIEPLPAHGESVGLLGYYWPDVAHRVERGILGPIPMPQGMGRVDGAPPKVV